METFMMVLFAVGVGYAILTAILGDVFGIEAHVGELPFLSPTIIATFVTVFGGLGYLMLHNTSWSPLPIAGVALMGALGVSAAVLFLVVLPLYAAQKGDALSIKGMIGLEAQVITAIGEDRLGEIVYEQGGTRHNAPAMSAEAATIPHGSRVRILDELAGTFVVEKI